MKVGDMIVNREKTRDESSKRERKIRARVGGGIRVARERERE